MTPPGINYSAPFVPLSGPIESLGDLMAFDRNVCKMFKQFHRPAHEFDALPELAAAGVEVFVVDGMMVQVTEMGVGIRMRIGFQPGKKKS